MGDDVEKGFGGNVSGAILTIIENRTESILGMLMRVVDTAGYDEF